LDIILQSFLTSGNKERNIQLGTCENGVTGEADFGRYWFSWRGTWFGELVRFCPL